MIGDEPRSVGRYEVRAELGFGGFATVYRAHDTLLRRDIALKVLHPHLAREPETRERFVREGRTLAQVHHRNIVRIYDAGEADGLVYLAMEIVDGPSLAQMLRDRGSLPLSDVVQFVSEAAGALAAVHAHGLVHCDVKPANILVDGENERAVLLDLGVARRVDETATATGGWLVGTPAFMAPEQVEPGRRLSGQTDVYQLAATAFALLAGEPPFTGEATQILYAVVNRPPAWLGDLRPELPARVSEVFAHALAKDPAERPQGPQAFASELADAARGLPSSSHAQNQRRARHAEEAETEVLQRGWQPAPADTTSRAALSQRDPARPRRSLVPWLVGGLLVLFAGGGLAALATTRGNGDSDGIAGAIRGEATAPAPVAASSKPAVPAAATATTAPQRPSPTPPPSPTTAPAVSMTPWPPALAASAAVPIAATMASRGYTPAGAVVPVPVGESTLFVQRGSCGDGCDMLFIFLDNRFLGTDWPEPSARILDVQPAGDGRFVASYADANGATVPVTFTWNGNRLRPNVIAPGQCQNGC